MLPGSSYHWISHNFCFICSDLITLLAPSIRHIALTHVRKSASTKQELKPYFWLITFFKIFPTHSKHHTTKREGGTNLLLAHMTNYDVIQLLEPELRSVYRDICVWKCWLKKVWVGMVHQRAIWDWTVPSDGESGLVCHGFLYSSDTIFDTTYKIKVLACVKSYTSFLTHGAAKGIELSITMAI